MPPGQDRCPSSFRTLLASTHTPFAVARFAEGAVIFRQGDACDSVMHIETGSVRLAVTTPSGKQAICGVLGAGAFLSEEALGRHTARRQTAIAMTATEVLVIAKAQMQHQLHTQQTILDGFLAHIVTRHARLEADLCDQLLHSSEERLAHTLVVLAGCDGQHPCGCALPHLSQEVLAEMIGTTRSRVNVFLKRFKKLGFIDQNVDGLRVKPSLLHVVCE
jgi:CRP-like cAMP-binding protein